MLREVRLIEICFVTRHTECSIPRLYIDTVIPVKGRREYRMVFYRLHRSRPILDPLLYPWYKFKKKLTSMLSGFKIFIMQSLKLQNWLLVLMFFENNYDLNFTEGHD